jgi:hypothetical protein
MYSAFLPLTHPLAGRMYPSAITSSNGFFFILLFGQRPGEPAVRQRRTVPPVVGGYNIIFVSSRHLYHHQG